jgi:hypothetical protein
LAEEVAKARAAGLRARMPVLTRRAPTDHKKMLIAEMAKLSPEELRTLLDQVITNKSSTSAGEAKSGEQALP